MGFVLGGIGVVALVRLEKLTKTLKKKGILEEDYKDLKTKQVDLQQQQTGNISTLNKMNYNYAYFCGGCIWFSCLC